MFVQFPYTKEISQSIRNFYNYNTPSNTPKIHEENAKRQEQNTQIQYAPEHFKPKKTLRKDKENSPMIQLIK